MKMYSSQFGKTVILAAGDYPAHDVPSGILKGADRILCCDSSVISLLEHGMEPDAVVGDLDSLPKSVRDRFCGKIIHISEQDDNDLAKTFRYAVSNGWKDIVILGATGKREDHTLGNISWLAEFVKDAPDVTMVSDYGVFRAFQPPFAKMNVTPGTQISIFSFSPDDPITATGLKYDVDGLRLRFWYTATLNEAVDDVLTFTFQKSPLVIFESFTH